MPYKSYNELIDDADEDPKLAKMRVSKAKQSNMPVVDPDNPGYGNSSSKYKDYRDKAIAKRMGPKPTGSRKTNAANMAGAKKAVTDELNKAIESRMKNRKTTMNPTDKQARGSREEEIVTKRKKYGY
jgi:hypothetical protein